MLTRTAEWSNLAQGIAAIVYVANTVGCPDGLSGAAMSLLEHWPSMLVALTVLLAAIFNYVTLKRSKPTSHKDSEPSRLQEAVTNEASAKKPVLTIKSAQWGTSTTPAKYKDFTDVVENWVDDNKIRQVVTPGPHLQDWCPGTPKHLRVCYSYGSVDDIVIKRESEKLTLPYNRSMRKARKLFAKYLDKMEYSITTILNSNRAIPFKPSMDHVEWAGLHCTEGFEILKDVGRATDINIDHWELRGFDEQALKELLGEVQSLKGDMTPFARGERDYP